MLFDLATFLVSAFGVYSYYYRDSKYTLYAMFATVIIFMIRNVLAGGTNNPAIMWFAAFLGLLSSFIFKNTWYIGIAIAVCWEEAAMSILEIITTLFLSNKNN